MTETTYSEHDPSPIDGAADGTEDRRDRGRDLGGEHRATLRWLEDEFPGWDIEIAESESWVQHEELRPIWIARKDGHHPQAELSAAKLHTRLSEYLERQERRQAMGN